MVRFTPNDPTQKYKHALFTHIVIELKFVLAHKHFSNMVHRYSWDGPTRKLNSNLDEGALCPGEALCPMLL